VSSKLDKRTEVVKERDKEETNLEKKEKRQSPKKEIPTKTAT
jgi:hypothetical protein